MLDPIQNQESRNEFRVLLEFLLKKGREINSNSQGQSWLKIVWNMIIPDLTIFTEYTYAVNPNDFRIRIDDKVSQKNLNISFNKGGFDNWSRHIRRSNIIETYSIIEHYFWLLESSLGKETRGMMSPVEKDIDEALNLLCNNEQVKEILNKAKEKCRRTKPGLLDVISAVLQQEKIEKGVIKKWIKFFNGFRVIRNSIHNNMVAKENYDKIFPNEWYPYEVKKGKPINPSCKVLMNIAERCLTFFDEVQL